MTDPSPVDPRQSLAVGAARDAQVLRLLETHPATAEMLVRLRWFPTPAKARKRLRCLSRQRRVLPVGTVWRKHGGPEDVYCGWRPSARQLLHEVELTELCLRLDAADIRRGPRGIDARTRPDAEAWINGSRFLLELDRGTMGIAQMGERFSLYEGSSDLVLWVCPTEARRDILRERAGRLRSSALFATYGEALADPHGEVWIDYAGNRARLPRQTRTPPS